MASWTPMTLSGDNLGQRHRHLNSLVRKAKETTAAIQDIEALPEESAVDRLFKIDLAIQLKHVDYIVRNLKDDDMLYVSRALKATWLIDHRNIINPKHLEEVLFPEMIKPAVTKMKHWLYINLRDPATCQEFYQHYKDNTVEYAVKFLSRCSQEFILAEAPKILSKLTPHSLKVLCEKCPGVAKIYFDSLATDEDVKTRYLEREQSYYNSVKCVLKLEADVFLDITEKYFNMNCFSKLSPLATDHILRYHKTRFKNKLELYVAYFLHIPTVAARLSVEECQEVVLKLARASYLQHWFQYKVVEPLIKRLSPDKRAAFKKRVFVDKDVGLFEDKWPYKIPSPPVLSDIGPHIFDDQDFMCRISPLYALQAPGIAMQCGATAFCAMQPLALNNFKMPMNMIPVKTDLDRLFDEFRFIGFERALHELGQRLVATASPDRRRDIFMVLVSKTGGRTDAVANLLQLVARHVNEPPHIRAAILRSLVKRAKVWRLPADVWQHFLDYGHGLGLDGTKAEAACREGLHAVVIRQLLAGECEPTVREAFMKDFSTLVEYSLKVDERKLVANGLENMLAMAATDDEPKIAADRLWKLLDVLKIYRVRIEPSSPAVKAVMALAARDSGVARPLLQRLYNERIARRELLRYNMEFRQDEAALLNALRHDPSVLDLKQVVDIMAVWNSEQRNFSSFASRPNIIGRSAPPSNSYTFGRPVPPSTGFTQMSDVGSSRTLPTGLGFRSATAPSTDIGSSVEPVTGFSSSSSTAQSTNDSISIVPPTDGSKSPVPPTGFRFTSSNMPPLDVSNSAAPLANVSATSPTDNFSSVANSKNVNNSAAAPIGISSTSPPTDVDSVATLPKLDSSQPIPQPTGFSNSVPEPMHFGLPAPQPMRSSFPAPQPVGFASTTPQPMRSSFPAPQPVGFASTTLQPVGFASTTPQPMRSSFPAPQPVGFASTTLQAMRSSFPAPQPVGFASTTPQPMRSSFPAPQPVGFASTTPQPMLYDNYALQVIESNPCRLTRFRRFGAHPSNFDRFISKLTIYFDQKQDFTTDLSTALTTKLAQGQNVKLARPLVSLYGNNFVQELRDFDAAGKKCEKFAAALRACAHRARPIVNLAEWGWRKAGVRAVATRAMRCREIERDTLIRTLATERRTVRVALALCIRSASDLLIETFASAAKMRPAVALRTALLYFRRHGVSSDLRVWEIVKPLISSINLETRERLRRLLGRTDWIPSIIKPDYCITLYTALIKVSNHNATILLRDLSKVLPECDQVIENILLQMLDDFTGNDNRAIPYTTIFIRYLLLSENEEDIERRFMKIGNRFLKRLDTLRSENNFYFKERLNQILDSLKYNSAFLDAKFPPCLSVIGRILTWLETFMPKEKYFGNYTQVRLTMLYFKAVRQSMKQMPEVFADPKRKKSEGVEAVGFIFGRYIVEEVAEYASTYFDSIIDLYTDGLLKYLNDNFMYGASRNIFVGFVLKGILTEAEGIQRRVAVYVLRDNQMNIEDSARKEIEEQILNDRSLQFFAHAELFSQIPIVPYRNNRLK
ncbi:hypothetical protein PYW08_010542 [Mythimna loreyi]|uniref:Uncharacterized protein n=1 Tax=Mythimna loreyi TaxID=667449 RepID=A0ACC2Q6Q1_9NEOP|nr:hypothetical protein PYW08_010542 [Mythimna loreyi]